MLSIHPKRHLLYTDFLKSCDNALVSVNDIIKLGALLMKKQKLHHHFFGDYSWLATAKALAYHVLPPHKKEHETLTTEEASAIFVLFEKRIVHKLPVEYITNQAEYCGHVFYVNEQVLVPRSLMSARFKEFLESIEWENYRVLDLCTGSGCIGITLALLNPRLKVDLVDISSDALMVAQKNVENHKIADRVRCIQSDAFENIQGRYDLIITNPPYISTAEYTKSPDEFKKEPKIALESGKDGLDLTHIILKQASSYLNDKGILIAEVGMSAAKRLKKHYSNIAFKWFKYKRPNGTESFFSSPGVFLCKKSDLP